MLPKVVQVNVSPGGVPKTPVPEAMITASGVSGDGHRLPAIHGGPLQAVLLVTEEAIEELKTDGFPVFPGALGENLTTRGLARQNLRTGQRYRVGDELVIELTKPRQPCKTLDVYGGAIRRRVWEPGFKHGEGAGSSKWALAGFYASVVKAGAVRPGAPILLLAQSA